MAGNPLASLPGLPQRPSLARSSASETRLTQPGIEAARSRKLNSAPTAAFRLKTHETRKLSPSSLRTKRHADQIGSAASAHRTLSASQTPANGRLRTHA